MERSKGPPASRSPHPCSAADNPSSRRTTSPARRRSRENSGDCPTAPKQPDGAAAPHHVPHQSELPRPPEARRSSDVSGLDHYAQSSNRTADERHVLDLLKGWKITMALLPASSGAKRKPLVTAPFDATAAKQYVSATAFRTGQAPLEQSDLIALSEALSAMSMWRHAKQAVPGETYAPAIAFSAPPFLAGLHPPLQPDHEYRTC